ncbi:hypothetical protein ACTXT7_007980 [Hymenolepis weldensis]
MLVCPPKRSAMVDDKFKEPGEIDLAKPISLAIGAVSKVVAQIAGEAVLHYFQDFMCFQTDIHWPHVDIIYRNRHETTPQVGVKIWMHRRNNRRPGSNLKTPHNQGNYRPSRYCRRFRRSQKGFKVDLAFNSWD